MKVCWNKKVKIMRVNRINSKMRFLSLVFPKKTPLITTNHSIALCIVRHLGYPQLVTARPQGTLGILDAPLAEICLCHLIRFWENPKLSCPQLAISSIFPCNSYCSGSKHEVPDEPPFRQISLINRHFLSFLLIYDFY